MFHPLINRQQPGEVRYLTKALRNEANGTLRARNTICPWCGAVVSDAALLKGRWGRELRSLARVASRWTRTDGRASFVKLAGAIVVLWCLLFLSCVSPRAQRSPTKATG